MRRIELIPDISKPEQFPVEGEYMIFLFSSDYTSGDSIEPRQALAIFQVKDGKLEPKWHPEDKIQIGAEFYSGLNEQAIEYLKAKRIRKVYSLNKSARKWQFPYGFLGLPLYYDSITDGGWQEYLPLGDSGHCDTERWRQIFSKQGIELKLLEVSELH